MKSKILNRIQFSLLALPLLLIACDDNSNLLPGGGQKEEGGEAWYSISLDTGMPAATRGEITEIDPWEYRVNEVWILLYDQNNILNHKWVLNIRNYTNGSNQLTNFHNTSEEDILENQSSVSGFRTVARKIEKKEYKMAVLANPPATLFNTLTIDINSNLSQLTNALDGTQRELKTTMFGGYEDDPEASLFFMSNANGLISLTPSSMQSSTEEAYAKPISVKLDRLLAKVTVQEKQGGVSLSPIGVIMDKTKPVNWYPDITNKNTYLIRRFAPLANGTEENEGNSPTGADRIYMYAEDPNFRLNENSNDQFNRWSAGDAIPYCTWISDNNSDPTKKNFQYLFENTLDVETQKHADWAHYTTRVMLEVYLIYPELLWNPNELHNENDPNRNYYSCQLTNQANETTWRIFTHEQAAHWLDRGFPYTEGAEAENKWIKLLEEKIKKIQLDYNQNIPGAFNFLSTQLPGTAKELYRSYEQVTYHPLGLNKYCIPVRHFGTAGNFPNPRETYGYYGIVRNNMYTLTINSITGPGIGIYDWENRYISAEISITPWFKRKQEVDLTYQ